MSEAAAWNPTFEQELDERAASALRDQRREQLAAPDRERLESITAAVSGMLAIPIIYVQGFEEIATRGTLAQKVTPAVVRWVDTIPRAKSAAWVSGLIATSLCSTLEDFIVDVGDARIDTTTISRLTDSRNLSPDQTAAKHQLLKATRPSVKKAGVKWLHAVEDVFGLEVAEPVAGSILPMIAFRNAFVHDPRTVVPVTGEEIKCWSLAVLLLATDIAFIGERRAA